MNVVVDTNRIIAALIKNGISRRIIMDNKKFEFLIPDHSLIEVEKYREEIKQKAHISDQEFEVLLSLLLEKIEIIPKAE
ncbi:MAG TPA: PIN domain-containing protein [Candidatus Nanoarchaeia archaeon]|nr:PIN domain-containing protein [Candidatus Nanoarchaeia archaeon]